MCCLYFSLCALLTQAVFLAGVVSQHRVPRRHWRFCRASWCAPARLRCAVRCFCAHVTGCRCAAFPGKDGHISFVEEYRFMLHRHWTLYDAMFHSSFMATRLGTWVSDTGRDKLEEFLAKIGIPLKDSRERWVASVRLLGARTPLL